MSAKVPAPLTGVWRREQITQPGGYLDDTSRVFWVQSDSWYGDIRLKIDVPRRPDARSFADFSDAELIALAQTEGFAGQLTVTPELCAWRRDMDFQPPGPIPDEGTWNLQGDVLIEGGVHTPYEEIWRLEPQSQGLRAAFACEDGKGLLIMAGDHFLMIADRAQALPPGEPLPALVRAALAAGDRDAACALLDMPICYGRIGAGWQVVHAAQPWREGRPLWASPRFFPARGVIEAGDEIWSLLEFHDPQDRLPGCFERSTSKP